MKAQFTLLLFPLVTTIASAQAAAPKYAAPPLIGIATINKNVGSPTLNWVDGKLVVNMSGGYNYRDDYTFDRIEISVKWSRNQGNPLVLQGPSGALTPEQSVVNPPNGTYSITAPPAVPPPGYTGVIVTARIVVKKTGALDGTDVVATPTPVAIPPMPKEEPGPTTM